MPKEGDLTVRWIPQIPGKAFRFAVDTVAEGKKFCTVLADYDRFQFENNIKPDYCNVGGISRFESDAKGDLDWYDVDEGYEE